VSLGGSEVFYCRECGTISNRDDNAVMNILSKGLAEGQQPQRFPNVPITYEEAQQLQHLLKHGQHYVDLLLRMLVEALQP
jgi:transposase